MPTQLMPPDVNDPCTKLYSDAYDDAVEGGKCPDTSRLEPQAKAAVELGYQKGAENQQLAHSANKYDPSGEYLTRIYHERNKWRFTV